MRGFKSFGPRKVTITLDKGFTVITGPNGSGKSNIMDAVRFVLGELSARALRADKFSAIIFEGTQKLEKSNSAWVAIHFDNSDKKIPVGTDVVVVAREVDRTGQSIYRLNGKKVSRAQLVDILAVASLRVEEYNMIMQGTVTRLADYSPEERREIIENVVGIAEYNAKKAQAQEQLSQADINLRVATAHIEEVQKRMESLERERNDAIRYNFIQGEIKRLQAMLTSYQIQLLQHEAENLLTQLEVKQKEAEELKRQRDLLQSQRDQVQAEWRKFDEEIVEKGGDRLISIQNSLGDISAQVASLRTEISSSKTSLTGLIKIREERIQHIDSLRSNIEEARKTLLRLKRQQDQLQLALEDRQSKYKDVSEKLSQLRQIHGESISKLETIDNELEELRRQLVRLNTKLEGSVTKTQVLMDNFNALEARRAGFETTLKNLQSHLKELSRIQREEAESLLKVEESIARNLSRLDTVQWELSEARSTVERAKKAVLEFQTQKDFAEKIAAEENALKEIEEMGKAGAISGIYGRLDDLISVRPEYRKAIEAASAGWLRAIVVENLETALKCVESLKRTKLGRIKLIPLKDIALTKRVKVPDIPGVIGIAADLVKCSSRFVPAVNFILGDTVVVGGHEAALLASREHCRSVTVGGDLYEVGGALESGYYRAPIDISSVIPRESAIKNLNESVKALDSMVEKRHADIRALEEEIVKLREDKVRRTEVIGALEKEIISVKQNVTRIKQNLKVLNRRVKRLNRNLEKEKATASMLEAKKNEVEKRITELQSQAKSIRLKSKPVLIAKYEAEASSLSGEINDFNRQLVKVTSEIASLQSNLETTLKPEFDRAKIDLSTVDKQILNLQNKIEASTKALEEAEAQLSKLNKLKEELSASLSSVRDERRKFEETLDRIDSELKKINSKYDPISDQIHHIEIEVQTRNLKLQHLHDELQALGYDKPLDVKPEEIRAVESSLNLMRLELEKLGSVNLLAITQYEQQVDNYKQYSIKRNQLEEEKRAILKFMEEIEQKKREAFMKAYQEVNKNFQTFFSRITGGGSAWLQLQNEQDPFAGGLDVFVQFPGKAARLISGASGGEKSVAAVSFIFAIQGLSPAPFYIFDEIDAHLDLSNAERLADLLREQSANTQFIVISLRDVIIDRAQRVFGVFLQDGLSSIVSYQLPGGIGK
ncbi:chromosome segregation protein SMC [Candidatus Bathyarchaeota archaeon]|nr:chromosome segregation protein SMC [Candidatus Bathyarchaeota archaeon]